MVGPVNDNKTNGITGETVTGFFSGEPPATALGALKQAETYLTCYPQSDVVVLLHVKDAEGNDCYEKVSSKMSYETRLAMLTTAQHDALVD